MRKNILFLLSILGILLLMMTSSKPVEFSGIVYSIKDLGETKIILIEDLDYEVVLFEKGISDLKLGEKIRVEGFKDSYEGREQIVAERIWRIY